MSNIDNQKKDDQKKYLVDDLGYLQPDDFEINIDKTNKDGATTLKMNLSKVPEFTAGRKVFLNPRIYRIWNYSLPKPENRTQDFYFTHPLIKTDTTTYKLPGGFGMETLPKAKKINFKYGSFTASYEFDESKRIVRSVARLELAQYKIPVADFLSTKKFFNEVLVEYTEKIVVKRL